MFAEVTLKLCNADMDESLIQFDKIMQMPAEWSSWMEFWNNCVATRLSLTKFLFLNSTCLFRTPTTRKTVPSFRKWQIWTWLQHKLCGKLTIALPRLCASYHSQTNAAICPQSILPLGRGGIIIFLRMAWQKYAKLDAMIRWCDTIANTYFASNCVVEGIAIIITIAIALEWLEEQTQREMLQEIEFCCCGWILVRTFLL